jgi:REP element-mobilizing transposase RayT
MVMPDHFHGIITLSPVDRQQEQPSGSRLQADSLGSIIGQFKSIVTKRCSAAGYRHFAWQEGYYDVMIRDGTMLQNVRHYIVHNPKHYNCTG